MELLIFTFLFLLFNLNAATAGNKQFPSSPGNVLDPAYSGNSPFTCAARFNPLEGRPEGAIDSPSTDITINVGEEIIFEGSALGGSQPLRYLWNFGPDSGAPDSTLQDPGPVQFKNAGTFTATLNVYDAWGISDTTPATRTITVRYPTIARTGWSIKYVDSQENVAEDGAAINAIDGDPETFWHTRWYPYQDRVPHEIQIDTGRVFNFSGFSYLPRQDGGENGRIAQYEFYISGDGINWRDPVASGTFANDELEKEVLFPATIGRFVRLRALTDVNDGPWTCVAEINLFGDQASDVLYPTAVIKSPVSDVTINLNDWINFSGEGIDPGNYLPLSYLWRFGTGSGIPDSSFESPGPVQFNIAGTFPVTLTVTNSIGLSSITPEARTITVKSLPSLLPDMFFTTVGPFNFTETGILNPVLTGEDVTDISAPRGVADPFLFHDDDGTWHMFFEVMPADYSRIGHATSPDGLQWTYDRIVLDTGRWISYPQVLKYDGNYYMVPETWKFNEVRVYQAAAFPYDWNHVATLAGGRTFVDPQVFRYNGTWWMFVSDTDGVNCYLYYSDDFLTGWVEHPMSPVIMNDAGKARGGGRAFVVNGQAYRIAQKDDVIYAEKVRAFAIDVLTKTYYAEHEIPESPILGPSGSGWNSEGMHHFDPWWAGDKWISVVDGMINPTMRNGDGLGMIGIYISR